ncbi:MAG: hypothetical protein ACK4FL_01110 [Microgenomates group bacterium]
MPKEIIHSLILIAAIGLTFLFPKTSLAAYDLQLAASLFIILFIAKKFFIPKDVPSRLMESVIFTLIVMGIVNTTGGPASPFFFLIYFLLFSLTLLLEPVISITTTLTLIIFFLLTMPENQSLKNLLPIFSLAFLTPFALFLGEEYLQNEKLKMKNEKLQEDTFLFLSLMLKNHLKNIKEAVENFVGDHQLETIKKSLMRMEKLIEKFERSAEQRGI